MGYDTKGQFNHRLEKCTYEPSAYDYVYLKLNIQMLTYMYIVYQPSCIQLLGTNGLKYLTAVFYLPGLCCFFISWRPLSGIPYTGISGVMGSVSWPGKHTKSIKDMAHLQWIYPVKMVMFHGYVSLSEGNIYEPSNHLTMCFLQSIIDYAGWCFGTFGLFFHIQEIIIPTDELICFRGVGIPPTSYQIGTFGGQSCWSLSHSVSA